MGHSIRSDLVCIRWVWPDGRSKAGQVDFYLSGRGGEAGREVRFCLKLLLDLSFYLLYFIHFILFFI